MHQICRLCNREVSDAINLFSEDSIKHGVADGMSTVLELPFKKEDGITSYVCQICNARFKQLIRRIEVLRLEGRKTFEKLASKAGVYPECMLEYLYTCTLYIHVSFLVTVNTYPLLT